MKCLYLVNVLQRLTFSTLRMSGCFCFSVFLSLSPSDLSTLSIEPTKRTGSTLSHKLCLNVSVMLYPAIRGRSCSTQKMDHSILSLWLNAGLGAKHQLLCLCAHEHERKSWKGSSSTAHLFSFQVNVWPSNSWSSWTFTSHFSFSTFRPGFNISAHFCLWSCSLHVGRSLSGCSAGRLSVNATVCESVVVVCSFISSILWLTSVTTGRWYPDKSLLLIFVTIVFLLSPRTARSSRCVLGC